MYKSKIGFFVGNPKKICDYFRSRSFYMEPFHKIIDPMLKEISYDIISTWNNSRLDNGFDAKNRKRNFEWNGTFNKIKKCICIKNTFNPFCHYDIGCV